MDDGRPRARRLIDAIMGSEAIRESSHFSERIANGEPILTTGRQMASYLPERYTEMRSISRFQLGADGRGRWLPEAEHFHQQALFMQDWEDDCPYRGTFKSYYPTYNSMSDRQLRGYFTWRARVRAGDVEETSPSFAFVYVYELLSGVGVGVAEEGFRQLRWFWRAWQAISDDLDRHMPVWLLDYCVYHGLDPELVADLGAVAHERALGELIASTEKALALLPARGAGRKADGVPPLGDELEERLFRALDGLSSYRIARSRLAAEHGADLRHVACAVYLRLFEHHRAHRKLGLIEGMFGQVMELPYTMFASAMFFDPHAHADTVYEVGPLRRYRCQDGLWTCARPHGKGGRSGELGRALRAVDQRLRDALGFPRPLKEDEGLPKYLARIIDAEVAARLAWSEARRPVMLDIDLGRLSGIRSAAAETREALLIDEEREDGPDEGAGAREASPAPPEERADDGSGAVGADGGGQAAGGLLGPAHAGGADPGSAVSPGCADAGRTRDPAAGPAWTPADPAAPTGDEGGTALAEDADTALSPALASYLRALLAHDAAAAEAALKEGALTEDLAVDAVNEALFDLLGDTALEFGPEGPAIIEDYREDLERIVNDAD